MAGLVLVACGNGVGVSSGVSAAPAVCASNELRVDLGDVVQGAGVVTLADGRVVVSAVVDQQRQPSLPSM